MRPWIAVVACAALAGLVSIVPSIALLAAVPHLPWLRLGAGILLLIDARRIRLEQYASGLGTHRIVWFLLAAAWPIVVLPWYLTVRERIQAGLTPLRAVAHASN